MGLGVYPRFLGDIGMVRVDRVQHVGTIHAYYIVTRYWVYMILGVTYV